MNNEIRIDKKTILKVIDTFYGEHYYVDGRKIPEGSKLAARICKLYSIAMLFNEENDSLFHREHFATAYANGFFDGSEHKVFNQNVKSLYRKIYSFGYMDGYEQKEAVLSVGGLTKLYINQEDE